MTDVNIFDLPAHPAAGMFPMMSDDEIEDLSGELDEDADGLI